MQLRKLKKEEENAELKHKVDELLKDKELTKEKQVNEVIAFVSLLYVFHNKSS